VINTPLEFIQDPEADVEPGMVERINDQLAALVAKNKGHLLGLATVDVYTGDVAAREVRRAVTELGLRLFDPSGLI
jgi:predicted TIM-barrel fold metal-dependent hydrolase